MDSVELTKLKSDVKKLESDFEALLHKNNASPLIKTKAAELANKRKQMQDLDKLEQTKASRTRFDDILERKRTTGNWRF